VAQFVATTGTMLIAKGYGTPTSGSNARGVWALSSATDAGQETSLFLTFFDSKQMDFGPPLGLVDTDNGVDSGNSANNALALVKLAP
jgi:hypothetical protein